MALAPATFLLGALIWSRLPETLQTGRLYAGFDADADIGASARAAGPG